jgi:hypothetical protein
LTGFRKLGSNSDYTNQFFESPPKAGFQKTDFVISSACGAGNNKIGFLIAKNWA